MTERDALLAWYDDNRRPLPWRGTRDPYAVWVSEVMLQQTRVETVVPYYERFMERFPTPAALAGASEDEVLSEWSGLGYYRRARLLHAGAREVVERYGGCVPEQPEARRGLPGVGRYTAGAIGSIAFDRAEPVVDGNVARLLARLRGIDAPLGRAEADRALWREAGALVQGPRPGDLNQALMELGARVCTPSSPSCEACPLRDSCVARREGRTSELPVPKKKKAPASLALAAVVATVGGRRGRPLRVWLVRSDDALFGGLWGPPMRAVGGRPDREAARAALREASIAARLGDEPAGRVEHVLSHRRLDVAVWLAPAARSEPADGRRAVPTSELSKLGVSKLTRKLLGSVGLSG